MEFERIFQIKHCKMCKEYLQEMDDYIVSTRKRALKLMKNKKIKPEKISRVENAAQIWLSCVYDDFLLVENNLKMPISEFSKEPLTNLKIQTNQTMFVENQGEIFGFLLEAISKMSNEEHCSSGECSVGYPFVCPFQKNISSILTSFNRAFWYIDRQFPVYDRLKLLPDNLIRILCSITLFACDYYKDVKNRETGAISAYVKTLKRSGGKLR